MQKNARKNTKFSKNETIFKIGHLAKAIAHTKAIYSLCKMFSLGQKLKNHWTRKLELFCAKKPLGKKPNKREKRQSWKSAPGPCKGYSLSKWSVSVKNLKCQKHAKNHPTRTSELFCARNRFKKNQIFEKGENFENRPCCKVYSACKGYSVCKIVSLGKTLKMGKIWKKLFHKNIGVVLCEKPLEKSPNIRETRRFYKSAISQWVEAMRRL